MNSFFVFTSEATAPWSISFSIHFLLLLSAVLLQVFVLPLHPDCSDMFLSELSVDGLYSQIYDEIYCDQDRYNKILAEFGSSDKYRVTKV